MRKSDFFTCLCNRRDTTSGRWRPGLTKMNDRNNLSTVGCSSERRIRIIVLVGSLGVGGAQKHIYDLLRLLNCKLFNVTVIVFRKGGFYYEKLERLGFTILDLNVRSKWDLPRKVLSFYKRVKQIDPDILHLFLYYPSLIGCIARLLPFSRRPRIILSKRSMNIDLDLDRYLVYRYILMKVPDAVTAVSRSVQQRCLQLGAKPGKVYLIENGIERIETKGKGRLKNFLGLAENCSLIGTVGSLTVRKGHKHFIDCIPHLLKEFPDVRFVLLGEGPLKSELEAQCNGLNISKYVYMPGYLAPAVDYMADLSIFVLPSLEEGMSNALLEAMMLGLPCVASDIPSNRELIDSGLDGVLVDVEDAVQLATAVTTLLGDTTFSDLVSSNARNKIEMHFTIDEMVQKNEKLYRQLINRPSKPGVMPFSL